METRDPRSSLPTTGMGALFQNAFAGFLVFLIAMPLCLAIARASGFPPIAGIWTAVIGGIICTLLSNSELTIKGPAAGLIVIVYGAVTELGSEFGAGLPESEQMLLGYKLALGIGVVSGLIQMLFGLFRAGKLADYFPLTPVHGMLAAIGIIIIAKQAYEVLGTPPPAKAGPLMLLAGIPGALSTLNPEIAVIGVVSLVILFGLPLLPIQWIKRVPAQLVVLGVAIGLGVYFDLEHEHKYLLPKGLAIFDAEGFTEFDIGPKFLVTIPEVLRHPSEAFAFPDFRGLGSLIGLQYLLLFSLIGSLESLLSAKAIELLDPWRRKTNFDRDLFAVGLANTISAAIGGLPMISEIIRSKANIDNGGRSRYANLFHGLCLLAFVLLLPNLIHSIPLAALGAMLVYTGCRLASPREFVKTYRIGSEQFIVFVGTILATLATDLLIGIGVGIGLKVGFHLWNGAPLLGLFRSNIAEQVDGDQRIILKVHRSALFSNWLGLRASILRNAQNRDEVAVDLSDAQLVDHSVMEKLQELRIELEEQGKLLIIIGLEDHIPLSRHPLAARRHARKPEPPSAVPLN
ncbi:MAG: SulP family inorganic anion transporter [Gemmataceae bacterium]